MLVWEPSYVVVYICSFFFPSTVYFTSTVSMMEVAGNCKKTFINLLISSRGVVCFLTFLAAKFVFEVGRLVHGASVSHDDDLYRRWGKKIIWSFKAHLLPLQIWGYKFYFFVV